MKIRRNLLIIAFLLLGLFESHSQVIKDLIANYDIGFVPKSQVDYVLLKINNHGKFYTKEIKYNQNLKVVENSNLEDDKITFRIRREYNDSGRILKESRIVNSHLGMQEFKKVFSWNDEYNAEVIEYDPSNLVIAKSSIEFNNQNHPIVIISYDLKGNLIGKETGEYNYDNNYVQICVYNNKEKLTGITITNITNNDINISFKNYVESINYERLKPLCKNWNELAVVMYNRKFKFDKENDWKSYKLEKLFFYPSSRKFEIIAEESTTRKLVYKK